MENREFKFRAWDTYVKPNKMVAPNNGDFIGWHSPSNWRDCYKIMQYTGLKDRNGKEIYEGDILFCNSFYSHKSLKKREYKAVVSYSSGMFSPKSIGGTIVLNFEDCEIIGNIYENPELLEK